MENGIVKRTERYKYLGNWIGEDEKATLQIEEKEKEVTRLIIEVNKIGKEEWLGILSTEARLTMYEKTIVPGIIYNLECWTKLEDKVIERIEKIQGKILKGILQLAESTAYWGILHETGIWPMEKKIWYHRLMLYQNMMTSDNERLVKIVIESQQEQNGNNWYSYTVKIAGKLGIQLEWIETMVKAKWKKEVK